MRKKSQSKRMWTLVIALSVGMAGCNLFHPTESHDADNDDAAALTLDGYHEFQKSNYDSARRLFNRAIAADSGYSEAWVGLAKCVLNSQEGLNAFELVSYAQKADDKQQSNGFLEMQDHEAHLISKGIDSVLIYLNKFIDRDTTGKTDQKVRFRDIADSYAILLLTKAALRIRNVQTELTSVLSADSAGMKLNLNTLNDLGDSLKPFLQDMAAASEAIKVAPDASAEIIKAYLPDSTRQDIGDEFYTDATVGLANTVIQLNDRAQTVEEERTEVFFVFGNGMDDDGDGCVDEEVIDNYDNDGDGEIDEDGRDYRSVVLVKNTFITKDEKNTAQVNKDGKTYDLTKSQVDSLNAIEKYETIDIDMNGKMGTQDPKEWQYVVRDPDDRDEQDNHLLKFAIDLKFPGKNLATKIKNKELIRHDTDINNIKYSLKKRKEMVGGCWANYSDEDFKKWFEGRNAK
ncbi:MAG: hypothetical protein IKS97_05430 [Fibrobacter sp.]|nr:hypothetical protein [Fibrobacter sp.]